MKEIQLTQGKVALIDDDDFEKASQFKWHTHSEGYAATHISREGCKRGILLMHRLLTNAPSGMVIDHKDNNKLNNQKSNLRICTYSQNFMHKGTDRDAFSRLKGVIAITKSKGRYRYWQATIKAEGKLRTMCFPFTAEGEIEAAKKYNEWASKYFGEYAYLNPV